MKIRASLTISFGILVFGCAYVTLAPFEKTTSLAQVTTKVNHLGQVLPITARAIMGRESIDLEVAQTEEQQALGLMYRQDLPANRGMLFPFQPARFVQFWMKDCLIALDLVFLRDGKIQAISAQVPPCKSNPCPTYGPNTQIDRVIELKAGRAAQLGLKIGDTVKIESIEPR